MKLVMLMIFAFVLQAASPLISVSKTPYEQFLCSVDFSHVATNNIAIVSVTATNRATGKDTTAEVIATSPVPAVLVGTKTVAFMVQNGQSGQSYLVSVRATDTTTSEKYEGFIALNVN